MYKKWVPKNPSSVFRARVWRRLIGFGIAPKQIAATFGCSLPMIYQSCRGAAAKRKRQASQMRARVWSRLWGPEFKMTQREISKIWRVSNVLVCREISELRYFTPALAA